MAQNHLDPDVTLRAGRGDLSALSQIYERYADEIYRYIYRRIGNAEEAEDIQSDVFLKMLEAISEYQDRGYPISAWLYRIAHDRVVDALRRRRKYRTISWDTWVGSHDGAEWRSYYAGELSAQVSAALALLGEDQRKVILLRFFAEMSTDEVANALGKTNKSVKALRHRALKTLAIHLHDAA